jgi:Flp pilus assembly protein TadD
MRRLALAVAATLMACAAQALPSTTRPFDPNDPLAGELDAARAAIAREAWAPAESRLVSLTRAAPDVAELWSLLGLVRRKQGALELAEAAYDRALALDPRHLGALEYMGELRLMQDDLPGAQALLARLESLCPPGCEEREELAAAIRAHMKAPAP